MMHDARPRSVLPRSFFVRLLCFAFFLWAGGGGGGRGRKRGGGKGRGNGSIPLPTCHRLLCARVAILQCNFVRVCQQKDPDKQLKVKRALANANASRAGASARMPASLTSCGSARVTPMVPG